MKKLISTLMGMGFFVMLAGCVSVVTSKKANPNDVGVHYFLPQPVIQMTPKKDGTMEVEVVYWRDVNNEYTVVANSYLGKYTFDLNVDERGFLGAVSFDADSSGLAKQALDSATELRVAKINANKEQAKTEAAEAKAKEDKQVAASTSAGAAVKKAQQDLAIAQSKVNLLMDAKVSAKPPTDIDAQILAAELNVAEKEVNLTFAVGEQAQLTKSTASTANMATANSADKGATTPAKLAPQAPEPSFLLVKMTEESVSLKPAFVQADRETWKPPTPPKQVVGLTIKVPSPVARLKSGRGPVAVVTANQPLRDVFLNSADVPAGVPLPMISLQSDNLTVKIHMADKTPRGDYQIVLDMVTEANAEAIDEINAKAKLEFGDKAEVKKPIGEFRTAKVRVE